MSSSPSDPARSAVDLPRQADERFPLLLDLWRRRLDSMPSSPARTRGRVDALADVDHTHAADTTGS
jgi:hypothetical protein